MSNWVLPGCPKDVMCENKDKCNCWHYKSKAVVSAANIAYGNDCVVFLIECDATGPRLQQCQCHS